MLFFDKPPSTFAAMAAAESYSTFWVLGSNASHSVNMKAPIEDGVVRSPHPSIKIPVCSFYDLAREKLLTNPEKTALVDDALSLTRAEVLARMQRYAIGFRQYGILPGDRVRVHLKNSVENLIAMYACVISGAVITLAKPSLTEARWISGAFYRPGPLYAPCARNIRYDVDHPLVDRLMRMGELRYQAQDSDSTHILTDEEFIEKVRKATVNLGMKGFFCMGRATGFVSASTFSLLDERDFKKSPVTDPRNTVLTVCYTSGTTGLPKGAELTHYSYVCSFYTGRLHLPWGETDLLLGHNPITHLSGMLFIFIAMLDGATCAVVPATIGPVEIMDAVDKYKATAALFYPTQLQALVRDMERTNRRLPSMRGIAVGGSVFQKTLAKAARKAFAGIENLVNVYGMTEACGILICQPKTGKSHTGMDVGVPISMAEVKVLDVATGRNLGPLQTGEICYRTESMMKGYYKRPEENADLFDKEGWRKSGDCGYYDEDGRFYVLDRVKQMIKCMGNQVVPAELEELLLRKHGAEVAEVCVVGLPHSEFGEVPAAAVVLTEEGSSCDRQELSETIKNTVKGNLAVYKHLYGGVFFVDSLPMTETAKVNRAALARHLVGPEETVKI